MPTPSPRAAPRRSRSTSCCSVPISCQSTARSTTERGFIHDERALAEALRSKQIAGAGIDVWDKEPPPPDHPLLQFDNVIASPHTAGVTREARANMGRIAAEQLIMTLDGKRPPRIVNPQ